MVLKVKEFSNELRASTKAPKNVMINWLEGPTGSSHGGNLPDSSMASEAYSKMLTIFIPLLVDEVLRYVNLRSDVLVTYLK